MQPLQVCVAESHTGVVPPQCASLVHATHSLVLGLQTGISPLHATVQVLGNVLELPPAFRPPAEQQAVPATPATPALAALIVEDEPPETFGAQRPILSQSSTTFEQLEANAIPLRPRIMQCVLQRTILIGSPSQLEPTRDKKRCVVFAGSAGHLYLRLTRG